MYPSLLPSRPNPWDPTSPPLGPCLAVMVSPDNVQRLTQTLQTFLISRAPVLD